MVTVVIFVMLIIITNLFTHLFIPIATFVMDIMLVNIVIFVIKSIPNLIVINVPSIMNHQSAINVVVIVLRIIVIFVISIICINIVMHVDIIFLNLTVIIVGIWAMKEYITTHQQSVEQPPLYH